MIKARTPDEIKAYIDGYNACFGHFTECLRNRKSVVDAVRKMEKYKAAVNGVVEYGGEQYGQKNDIS